MISAVIICVSVYLLGAVVTTIICYYTGVEKDDALGIALFWVICLPILLIFKILAFPLYIYDLLEKKKQKVFNDE